MQGGMDWQDRREPIKAGLPLSSCVWGTTHCAHVTQRDTMAWLWKWHCGSEAAVGKEVDEISRSEAARSWEILVSPHWPHRHLIDSRVVDTVSKRAQRSCNPEPKVSRRISPERLAGQSSDVQFSSVQCGHKQSSGVNLLPSHKNCKQWSQLLSYNQAEAEGDHRHYILGNSPKISFLLCQVSGFCASLQHVFVYAHAHRRNEDIKDEKHHGQNWSNERASLFIFFLPFSIWKGFVLLFCYF